MDKEDNFSQLIITLISWEVNTDRISYAQDAQESNTDIHDITFSHTRNIGDARLLCLDVNQVNTNSGEYPSPEMRNLSHYPLH